MTTHPKRPPGTASESDFNEVTVIGAKPAQTERESEKKFDPDHTVVGVPENAIDQVFDASTVIQQHPSRLSHRESSEHTPPPVSRAVPVPKTNPKPASAAPALTPPPTIGRQEPAAVGLIPPSTPAPTLAVHRTAKTEPLAKNLLHPMETTFVSNTVDDEHEVHEAHLEDDEIDSPHAVSLLARLKKMPLPVLRIMKTRNGMMAILATTVVIFVMTHKSSTESESSTAVVNKAEFASTGDKAAEKASAVTTKESEKASGGEGGEMRTDAALSNFDRAYIKTQDQR